MKKTHRKALGVNVYFEGPVQPYSQELLEESKGKLAELARKDNERIMLEAAKNKVESYIYMINNKLTDDEDNINAVSTEEQREELKRLAMAAEDWLYDDGSHADLSTMEAKYDELSTPAEKVWFRVKEMTARPEAMSALKTKLDKVTELMMKWESAMPQVTEEERSEVLSKVEEVKKWIAEKESEQAAKAPHEEPAFASAEVPLQTKPLEKLVSRLSKKPKPKPEKKDNATKTEGEAADENKTKSESKETDGNSTDGDATADGGKEEKVENMNDEAKTDNESLDQEL